MEDKLENKSYMECLLIIFFFKLMCTFLNNNKKRLDLLHKHPVYHACIVLTMISYSHKV